METFEYINAVASETGCYDPHTIQQILAESYSIDVRIEDIRNALDYEMEDYYLIKKHAGL